MATTPTGAASMEKSSAPAMVEAAEQAYSTALDSLEEGNFDECKKYLATAAHHGGIHTIFTLVQQLALSLDGQPPGGSPHFVAFVCTVIQPLFTARRHPPPASVSGFPGVTLKPDMLEALAGLIVVAYACEDALACFLSYCLPSLCKEQRATLIQAVLAGTVWLLGATMHLDPQDTSASSASEGSAHRLRQQLLRLLDIALEDRPYRALRWLLPSEEDSPQIQVGQGCV